MRRVLLFFLLLVGTAHAGDGWKASLTPHFRLPALFLAVDKESQRTYFVRPTDEALDREELVCTTGRRDGDKQKEGDLKTPEGVYFIGDRIKKKLDYTLYGNTAFALNYPNPMDRLRGKTGYGIWIHGRGTPITPKLTRGCVALQNPRVDTLHEHITPHLTPVVIAQTLDWDNASSVSILEVARGTWSWIGARERRDPAFFEFYNASLYEKSSGAPFADFVREVQEESARHPWVDIRVENLHVLEGPGYMVSSFIQHDFPHVGKSGHRRLYWTGDGGVWRIAGEERVELGAEDREGYARLVDKEIRTLLLHGEALWTGGDRAALAEIYAPQCEVPVSLNASNPFSGEPVITIAEDGVRAVLSRPGGTSHTFLFRPGPFDTWLIVNQSGG